MVDKVAVVPIVMSVRVEVAGGESVRNMSVLRVWRVSCCSCGLCTCHCRHRYLSGGAAAHAILTVVVVAPLLLFRVTSNLGGWAANLWRVTGSLGRGDLHFVACHRLFGACDR